MTHCARTLAALLITGILAGTTAVGATALAGAPGPAQPDGPVVLADGPVVPTGAFDWE